MVALGIYPTSNASKPKKVHQSNTPTGGAFKTSKKSVLQIYLLTKHFQVYHKP
jgi:hypothetical protein